MTTDTATLTRQGISAMLRKAGFTASTQATNGRVAIASRSFGFSVVENGERVYTCKSCWGRGIHRTGCSNPTGAAKNWRSSVEKDGTVQVEVHGSTSSLRNDITEVEAMAQEIVSVLEQAGLTVTVSNTERGIFSYRVSA